MDSETPQAPDDSKIDDNLHPAVRRIVEALAVADARRDYDAAVAEIAQARGNLAQTDKT